MPGFDGGFYQPPDVENWGDKGNWGGIGGPGGGFGGPATGGASPYETGGLPRPVRASSAPLRRRFYGSMVGGGGGARPGMQFQGQPALSAGPAPAFAMGAEGASMGASPQAGAAPNLPGNLWGLASRVGAGNGNPRGPLDPSHFDDSWFYGPQGNLSGGQFQWNLLGAGGRGGAYDPLGSPAVLDAIRASSSHDREDRVRNAQLQADVMNPDDPLARAYARISATSGAEGDATRAMDSATLAQRQQAQQFYQQLVQSFLGGAVNRKDQQQPNPWAQAGGQIGGASLGALLGGLGHQ